MLFVSRSFCIVQLQHDYAFCREKLKLAWIYLFQKHKLCFYIDTNDLNCINLFHSNTVIIYQENKLCHINILNWLKNLTERSLGSSKLLSRSVVHNLNSF